MPQGIRVDPTDFIYRLAQLQGIFQGTALAYNNIFQTPYGRRMRIMFFNAGAATNILRVGQFQTSSTSNDSSFSTQLTYAMGMGNIANIASAALGNCTVQVQFDDVSQSNLAVADLSVVAGALTFGSLTNMVDDNLSTSGGIDVIATRSTTIRVTKNFSTGDVFMMAYQLLLPAGGGAGAGSTYSITVTNNLTSATLFSTTLSAATGSDTDSLMHVSFTLAQTTAINIILTATIPAPNGNNLRIEIFEIDYIPINQQSDEI